MLSNADLGSLDLKKVSEVLNTPDVSVMQKSQGLANVASTNKISTRFLLVDTKPDYDINWSDAYQCDSWKDAYGKMVKLIIEVSPDNLEGNLINGNAIIKAYSAQTFDNDGIRHVYHIIGI